MRSPSWIRAVRSGPGDGDLITNSGFFDHPIACVQATKNLVDHPSQGTLHLNINSCDFNFIYI